MNTLHIHAAIITARRDFEDAIDQKTPDPNSDPYQSLKDAFASLHAPGALDGLSQDQKQELAEVSAALCEFALSILKKTKK